MVHKSQAPGRPGNLTVHSGAWCFQPKILQFFFPPSARTHLAEGARWKWCLLLTSELWTHKCGTCSMSPVWCQTSEV